LNGLLPDYTVVWGCFNRTVQHERHATIDLVVTIFDPWLVPRFASQITVRIVLCFTCFEYYEVVTISRCCSERVRSCFRHVAWIGKI